MKATRENPILYIVIPCYNEQEVLPITSKLFLKKITDLVAAGKISDDSRVLFVNDGSKDKTWSIICDLAKSDKHYIGISQSRNRGHQNAVLAGLMEAKDKCDITISIDCDGQDDINAMDAMVDAYVNDGCEVVYGVRSKRDTDTFFKRFTAESFYKLLNAMGAEVVYNHADYRLMSARSFDEMHAFMDAQVTYYEIDTPFMSDEAVIDAIKIYRMLLDEKDASNEIQAYRDKYQDKELSDGYYGQKTVK